MAPYRLTKRLMPLVQLAHQPDSAMLAGDPTAVRRRPVAVGGRNRIPGEEIKTHRNTLVGRLSCESDRILAQPGFAREILRGSPWPPCWRGQRLSTRSSHKHLNPRTQRNHLQRHRNRQSIRSQTSNICSGQLLYTPILHLALILPASTFPLQIVQADRWLASNSAAAKRGEPQPGATSQ